MQGIVFKQSYKSKNLPSTRVLNIKHLEYIATWPGVKRNVGCDFGLFGNNDGLSSDFLLPVSNLKEASKAISEVSKRRTVYRAMISVDHDTAVFHELYSRKKWEQLLANHLSVVAAEMKIDIGDFRWYGAMHYKKNHPHAHIVYWDDSSKVRTEFIAKEKFGRMADRVKAEFNRSILGVEIKAAQTVKADTISNSKLQMLAMLKEMNPAEYLDICRVKDEGVAETDVKYRKTIEALLTDNSRRYAYLRPETKNQLDSFTTYLFNLPQFSKLKGDYVKAAVRVSTLYGNSKDTVSKYYDIALERFSTDVGNTLLKHIKETEAVSAYLLTNKDFTRSSLNQLIKEYVSKDVKLSKLYQGMLKSMPSHRVPLSALMEIEDFKTGFERILKDVTTEPSISKQLGLMIHTNKAAVISDTLVNDKTDIKAMYKGALRQAASEEYKNIYALTKELLLGSLYQDSGYAKQFQQATTMNMLSSIFRLTGQSKNHIKNQALSRERSLEQSSSAKKDRRVQKRQSEGMEI